ncbi:hypothetical protein I6F11_06915 [Ensifer sp. NBAIM29]|nr:hypothetical protein [Ensifer sp. NBAIM29]
MEMLNPVTDRGGQKQQDIGARLQFMQLDAASCESIRTLKTLVERELPIGLDKFYAQLRQSPEVKRFFSSEEHIARAKGAQKGHWTNISNGDFGADYVQKVRTIVEAAREQATALQEINTAVNRMDQTPSKMPPWWRSPRPPAMHWPRKSIASPACSGNSIPRAAARIALPVPVLRLFPLLPCHRIALRLSAR